MLALPLLVILHTLLLVLLPEAFSNEEETLRSYGFHARPTVLPLLNQLQFTRTQLYDVWPKRSDQILPQTINAAVVHSESNNGTLMGEPIHVQVGDRLRLKLTNHLSYSGLSIHMHGFGFGGDFVHAGAIGVSQCPLTEGDSFTYDFVVNEMPGTYWYHTQSEHLGVDAVDAIRGPVIVHPHGSFPQVDNSPLSYDYERILFFQAWSLLPSKVRYAQQISNSNGPVVKNEDGFVVSSVPWGFGTCNGKLREVIHVTRNKRYKFRFINGGAHHALRIRIDNFPLNVVAADAEAVEARTVDELVIHVGERFDVFVDIYDDLFDGESFWIRADSLEPISQGFTNGIRAILRVSENGASTKRDSDVEDPLGHIQRNRKVENVVKTLNCNHAKNAGCIPITELRPLNNSVVGEHDLQSEFHSVDFHFRPAPQYSHFVRIDGSHFTQSEITSIAMGSRSFDKISDLHPHTVMLQLSRSSPNIIVWRTTLLIDIPFHIHGHKVEILDIAYPSLRRDCTLQACKLSNEYSTSSRLQELAKIPLNTVVKKDTFVVPAGGAVVTRLIANNRGLWLAAGQMDVHSEDGISFVVNVGAYPVPPDEKLLLPIQGFPSCSSKFVTSMQKKPACKCYVDRDAPLRSEEDDGTSLCSRPHLCMNSMNLESFKYDRGFYIQSVSWNAPRNFVIAIFIAVAVLNVILIIVLPPGHGSTFGRFSRLVRSTSNQTDVGSKRRSNINIRLGRDPSGCSFVPPMSSIFSGEDQQDDHSKNECAVPKFQDERDVPAPTPSKLDGNALSDEFPIKSRRAKEIVDGLGEQQLVKHSYNSVAWRLSRTSTRSSFSEAFHKVFSERGDDESSMQAFEFVPHGYNVQGKIDIVPVDQERASKQSPYLVQVRYLLREQWCSYIPLCFSILRLLEVVGVACLMGGLFGNASDATTKRVAEMNDLVLLSSLYLTFSRMYPAVVSHYEWFVTVVIIFKYKRFSLMPVYMTRMMIVLLTEGFWPILYCFICFPLAGLAGDVKLLCRISFLLASNNICYVSIGAVIGSVASCLQYGMTLATVICQGTILASGVFISLPLLLEWARILSPFYWTVQGILKSIFRWSDNFGCAIGSSTDLPSNQCFIEFDPIIDRYKRRGISVATFNDPLSDNIITTESLVTVLMSVVIQFVLFVRCFLAAYRVNWDELSPIITGKKTNTTNSSSI